MVLAAHDDSLSTSAFTSIAANRSSLGLQQVHLSQPATQSIPHCCRAGCCFLVGGTQYHQQSFNAGFNKVGSQEQTAANPASLVYTSTIHSSKSMRWRC